MAASIEVAVKETESATVAFLPMKAPYTQIAPSFGRLYQWISEKGYIPSGPPIGVYFNAPAQVPEEELAWELQSPIAGDIPPSGVDEKGLGVKKLETVRVASTMHRGSFEKIGETYAALSAWIAEHGYEMAGPTQEVYFSNPAEVSPEELLTEIHFPVRKSR